MISDRKKGWRCNKKDLRPGINFCHCCRRRLAAGSLLMFKLNTPHSPRGMRLLVARYLLQTAKQKQGNIEEQLILMAAQPQTRHGRGSILELSFCWFEEMRSLKGTYLPDYSHKPVSKNESFSTSRSKERAVCFEHFNSAQHAARVSSFKRGAWPDRHLLTLILSL